MARVFKGEVISEPNGGLGHIAEAVREKYPENELNVTEINFSLCEVLEKKGFNVENEDFLKTTKKADVFFMNPPFENLQDIDHVIHAYKLLNPGGRIVAIMADNKSGTRAKVQEFNQLLDDTLGYCIKNEAGSFKSAFNSTNVSTITAYLEKAITATEETETEPQEETKTELFQGIQGELF